MKHIPPPPGRIRSALPILMSAILATAITPASLAETASLKFKESYAESLKCASATNKCKIIKADDYTATFSIPFTASQSAAIGKNTVIAIRLGGLRFDQKLGRKYKTDTRTAEIRTIAKSRTGKKVGLRTMEVTVTDDKVLCEITSSVRDLAGARWKPVVAAKSALRKARKFKKSIPAAIQIGEDNYSFKIKGKGRVTKERVHGTDNRRYQLSKLTFRGGGKRDVELGPMPVVVTMGTNSPAGDATLGTGGGSIPIGSGPLQGINIEVPAGALVGDTPIIISSNDIQLTPRAGTFTGTAVNINTGDQNSFDEPLTVTIPINNGPPGTVPVPYYIDEDGLLSPCQVTSIDHTNGTMSFQTFHASPFAWLWAELTNFGGHTAYTPADGFQVGNPGSTYNPAGECFGMSAFAQWFYANQGGGLFPKYMDDIPSGAGTVKGQRIIATRAHTSVSRLWNSYLPNLNLTYNLTGTEVYATITNILDNTARPTILYLNANTANNTWAHAVLAYDHVGADEILINDPNFPGEVRHGDLSGSNLTYDSWQHVSVIGNGSFRTENFANIYADAEAGFHGEASAQVNVTSHTDGEHVTDRTIQFSGTVESGSVLVDKLTIWLNGTAKFEQNILEDGSFTIPINLVVGENRLTFETSGILTGGNRVNILNTQTAPFVVNLDSELAQILVTLSWNTNDTDLDLYVIDPTGDYSAYYHRTTADGGDLDYDDTDGYGPEHWTLLGTDTVRWDEPYDVRIHYYSDHQSEEPTIASRWDINVLMYEGTDRAESYNFTGVLSYDDSSNRYETNTGADWADVVTVVPVQETATGTASVPRLEPGAKGVPRLIIPVPSEAEMIRLKENPPPRR